MEADWTLALALIYLDLLDIALEKEGKSHSLRTKSSVLRNYLGFLGMTELSPVGPELFHQESIEAWLTACKSSNLMRSYKSRLQWWQRYYSSLVDYNNLPADSRERTRVVAERAIERVGSHKALAKKMGISNEMLQHYVAGRYPVSMRTHAVHLEREAGVLPGSLSAHMQHEIRTDSFFPRSRMPQELSEGATTKSILQQRQRTLRWMLPANLPELPLEEQDRLALEATRKLLGDPQRAKRRRARAFRYAMAIDEFPASLRTEVEQFMDYMTLPLRSLKAKGLLLRPESARPLGERSVHNWYYFFRDFFGWCVLEDEAAFHRRTRAKASKDDKMLLGGGMEREELTLGLLAIPHIVDGFLDWRYTIRTDGDNLATPVHLGKFAALNNPKTGYLTHNQVLIDRVPVRHIKRYQLGYISWLDDLHDRLPKRIREERLAAEHRFSQHEDREDSE